MLIYNNICLFCRQIYLDSLWSKNEPVLHNHLLINNDRSYLPPGVVEMINGSGEGVQNGIWRQEAGIPKAEVTQ